MYVHCTIYYGPRMSKMVEVRFKAFVRACQVWLPVVSIVGWSQRETEREREGDTRG